MSDNCGKRNVFIFEMSNPISKSALMQHVFIMFQRDGKKRGEKNE